MITFYFIRHGETTWNKSGRYQGTTDVPLSGLGHLQADLTAKWFENIPLDGVISSSLSRASETAEKIAKPHRLDVEKTDMLQELCFGDWEGLTYDEIESKWPGMINDMYHHPELLRLPHGESFGDLQKRTMAEMANIIHRGDDKSYAVVCHGAAIRAILCGLLNIPLERSWNFSVHNASVTCMIHYPGDRTILSFHNFTGHLTE